jgi:NAD(P)H dehydrogenase (quinone)
MLVAPTIPGGWTLIKILVCFDSRSGHTESMARSVAAGAQSVPEVEVELREVDRTRSQHLVAADGIILGTPTHFAQMSARLKTLIDDSIEVYGSLNDKVGGAFASAGVAGGGGETAVLSLILALLSHKMVLVGDPSFTLGPLAVGKPTEEDLQRCRDYGERVAQITRKLHGN